MRISLDDVSLWFDVSGPSVIPQEDTTAERPVVVAVHGGPGLDHMTVKSALGPLAEDFQVLYFDLRGHGRSDRSSAEFWNPCGPGLITSGGWPARWLRRASRWCSAAASAGTSPSPTRRCSLIIRAASSWPTRPAATGRAARHRGVRPPWRPRGSRRRAAHLRG